MILLVDDEPTGKASRHDARQLTRAGYKVQAVSNGTKPSRCSNGVLCDDAHRLGTCRESIASRCASGTRDAAGRLRLHSPQHRAAWPGEYHRRTRSRCGRPLTKPPDDSELKARLNTGLRIVKLEQSLRAANRQNPTTVHHGRLTGNRQSGTILWSGLPREIERACRTPLPPDRSTYDARLFQAGQRHQTRPHTPGDEVLKGCCQVTVDSIRLYGFSAVPLAEF